MWRTACGRCCSAAAKGLVLTSATLGVGDPQLGYFRGRVGAEKARALCIGSPFDYQQQMRVRIYKSVPDPGTPRYDELLAEGIRQAVTESEGRAFVLFTSYRTMRDAARRLEAFFRTTRLAGADARRGHAAPQDDRGIPQGRAQRAVRHRQLLDRRRCAGRGAVQRGGHPPALRGARSSAHRLAAGSHRGGRRQSVHGILGAGGDPQAAPGRGPPDPHRSATTAWSASSTTASSPNATARPSSTRCPTRRWK